MDRAGIGRSAEDVAADFLTEHGLTVLLRNYRRRSGELDLVARDGDVLVVAEAPPMAPVTPPAAAVAQ